MELLCRALVLSMHTSPLCLMQRNSEKGISWRKEERDKKAHALSLELKRRGVKESKSQPLTVHIRKGIHWNILTRSPHKQLALAQLLLHIPSTTDVLMNAPTYVQIPLLVIR